MKNLTIPDLDLENFSYINQDNIFRTLCDIDSQIIQLKRKLFASSFVHYFHINPEALLLAVGHQDPYLESCENFFVSMGFSVFRIDTNFVNTSAHSLNPHLTRDEKIQADYIFNDTLLRNNYIYNGELLPNGIQTLYESFFSKFSHDTSTSNKILWNNISTPKGGRVWGRHNLDELLFSLSVDPTLKINIERHYLQASINCANSHHTPVSAL